MKVLIAGDYCPQDRVAKSFSNKNYASVFEEVQDKIKDADYSIINFECPVVTSDAKPIEKCGPNLCCSEDGVSALKYAGFDCVCLANNHFLDYGEKGVSETLSVLDAVGIDHVGGGMNSIEAAKVLYKELNGQKLAIINCCEHEFSIATAETAGANPLNPIKQYYSIQESKKISDYVIVIVHGGNEHYQLPSPRMQDTYRFFIDAGADAVINHHQHCFNGYEFYKGKPIFYGLGNFCFDNPQYRSDIWNKGYMVGIEFNKNSIEVSLLPYIQCSEEVGLSFLNEEQVNGFQCKIQELNSIISDGEEIRKRYSDYIQSNNNLRSVFAPYKRRITMALFERGLLPSTMTRWKKTLLLAYIQCESHYPKVISFLKDNK